MNKTDTPLIVLGMHRSGTSLLAGTLQASGVFLGEAKSLMPAQAEINAKGFWEHESIVAIHDEILTTLGSHWSHIASLPEDWHKDSRIEPYRKALIDIIRKEFSGSGLWGLKDPRMCRLLPLWLSIFKELNTKPKFIIISRHPYEVAASLTKRDRDLTWQYSLFLWLKYVLDAEQSSAGYDRSWITFEALNNDWQKTIIQTGKDLDIQWPLSPDSAEVKNTMKSLVSDGLWHNRSNELVEKNTDDLGTTLELYTALCEISKDPEKDSEELKRIQNIRERIIPTIRLIDESSDPLRRKYFERNEIISDLETENTLLVQHREEHAAVNKSLREENELLVEQRDEHASVNKGLHEENVILVKQRDELFSKLNSGLIGLLNRLQK